MNKIFLWQVLIPLNIVQFKSCARTKYEIRNCWMQRLMATKYILFPSPSFHYSGKSMNSHYLRLVHTATACDTHWWKTHTGWPCSNWRVTKFTDRSWISHVNCWVLSTTVPLHAHTIVYMLLASLSILWTHWVLIYEHCVSLNLYFETVYIDLVYVTASPINSSQVRFTIN